MYSSLKSTIALSLVCSLLVGYNYLDAQWVGPSTSPTGGNAPAPINASGDAQNKSGALGLGGLEVFGPAAVVRSEPHFDLTDTTAGDESWSFRAVDGELHMYRLDTSGAVIGGDPAMRLTEHDTDPNDTDVYFDRNLHANHIRSIDGSFELQDSSPEIQFIETDQSYSDWRYKVQVNNDIFRIETSRDGSGSTDPTTPMRLFAGAASTSDWVEFSNQVRAVEYCDEDGNNCADPALDFGGGGGPACTYRLYSYDRTSACAITPSVPSCGLGAARTSNVQSESVGCTGSETRNRIRCTLLECC